MTALANSIGVEALTTAAQKLTVSRTEQPSRFIRNDKIESPDELPVLDVQAIDVAILLSSSKQGQEERRRLRDAISSCGYFQAVNHGIPTWFLDQVHETTRRFFHLPTEEKMKCAREVDDVSGYGNDMIFSKEQIIDWNNRLYLMVHPEEQRKMDKWPQNPQNFREMLFEFSDKMKTMNDVILKAMARSLNLEENSFTDQMGENPNVLSRFNHYPPCPKPQLVLAAKPHGDAGVTTYLLQDKLVEGLQTLKDDQWYRVPIIPDALLVNVGDQIEIMSNGIFKSPIHRVVTDPKRERITSIIFFGPDPRSEIHPAEGLIDDERARKYKSVVDYTGNYFFYAQQGKRPIDALKF